MFRRRNLVFKEVKQPQAASVDTLLHQVETHVLSIDCRDHATVVPEGFDYDPALPLYVAGRAFPVVHFDTDTFWLETVTDLRVGDVVKQSAPVGHLDLVFQAFEQQWRQRWCKHDAVPFSHWTELVGFVKARVHPQPMQHLTLDAPLLKAEIHRKKPSAACGLDGVSRTDLVQADVATLDSYLALYRHAERHGVWPEQFMHGKVALLAKVPDASRPDSFRPISVFPLGYRLWSGAHARSLLAQTDSWVHPSVFGNRPGFQAAHLWSTVGQEIELAYASQRPLSGLVADVIKAFNCVPRFPVLTIAVHVGTPPAVTTAWASALHMTRHFQVRNSFSPGFTTSTGVAEGCGLSVYAMLLIDHVFGLWMDFHSRGSLRLLTYVDNIECLTWDPAWSVRQLAMVESFTSAFDLSLDRKKTYLWSTCPRVRQDMRLSGHQVKHFARDVGGHVGYSRQYTNATVQARVRSLGHFGTALRKSLCSFSGKLAAIRVVAWPKALHAVSSAPVGLNVWKKLRRAVTASLGVYRAGMNSSVFTGLVLDSFDPQLLALIHIVRLSCVWLCYQLGSACLCCCWFDSSSPHFPQCCFGATTSSTWLFLWPVGLDL